MANTKKASTKAEDMKAMVDVEATTSIRHGVKNGDETEFTDYVEGDVFSVTRKEAIALAASGAAIEPGTKTEDTSDEEAAKQAAAIEEANKQAEADKAAAAAEAAKNA